MMLDKSQIELKNFVDNVTDKSHLRVEKELGDGFFQLRASEAQRRQAQQDIRCVEDIVIEILRNSRDANAKNIFLATNTEENFRHILIIDDGDGVSKAHHKDIFKPYVTSKLDNIINDNWGVHGRGMALYSTFTNSEEAFVVNSEKGIGCSIYIKCDTNKLTEKRDQSTFPNFYINEENELVIRGPKNILRNVCEFAVESRNQVNVYVGTPAEIASTLYNISHKKNNINAVFKEPDKNTKLVDLLGFSSDVHDFKAFGKSIGILLSKRTARRIMDGDISPQKNMLTRISNAGIENKSNSNFLDNNKKVQDIFNITKIHKSLPKHKNIKISDEDKKILTDAVKYKFNAIADKYYLNKEIEPKVTLKNNKISISFEFSEDA